MARYLSFILQPLPFETLIDHIVWTTWTKNNWHYTFYIVIFYYLIIFTLKEFMKNRQPFNLRTLLVTWNFFIAGNYIFGLIRILPTFFNHIKNNEFIFLICDQNIVSLSQIYVFWTWYYNCFKILELGDTVFLVLRKKNLTFLHLFHHSSVVVMIWYSMCDIISISILYGILNSVVHTYLYIYLTLLSSKVKIPPSMPLIFLLLEVGQMMITIVLITLPLLFEWKGKVCNHFSNELSLLFIAVATILMILTGKDLYDRLSSIRKNKYKSS